MRFIRINLQIIIVIIGGIFLATLIYQPSPKISSIIFLLGFVCFLLALTLVLKEHSDNRAISNHKTNPKPMSIVLLLLGIFGLFHGVSYFIGNEPLPMGESSCRTICGLILLASQLFGEPVGKLVAGSLWSGLGFLLCYVGFKLR
jgi:hypothetical protein